MESVPARRNCTAALANKTLKLFAPCKHQNTPSSVKAFEKLEVFHGCFDGFWCVFYEVQAHQPTDEKPIKTHDKTVKKKTGNSENWS
jgi:hypothetical protein